MKKGFIVITMIIFSTVVFSQLPKGPDGKDLYQKGECKVLVPNVSMKCVFCEDKELTRNCKEYKCSLTECTEVKSSKGADGRSLSKPVTIDAKQLRINDGSDTTSKLPKGTKFENGKLVLMKGYKAVYTSGKKMVAIMSDNGESATGTFRCTCGIEDGSCGITIGSTLILCEGPECCSLVVSIPPGSDLTLEKIEKTPEKLKWKKLIFPAKIN